MLPLSYDNLANEPLIGRLSPSAHPRTSWAIFSGGCHLALSMSAMACLLAGVSMTWGKMQQTVDDSGISVRSAIYSDNACVAALLIA